MTPAIFDTLHNDAFRTLGALEPIQHWSAFDVSREQARKGNANRFVTTIWNYHSIQDKRGHRSATELAICEDERTGSLWYQVPRPTPGTTRLTWVAHWKGIRLALDQGVPIIGVLKDVATTKCALLNLFDIPEGREQTDGSAIWLRLVPRGGVGCQHRRISIDQLTCGKGDPPPTRPALTDFDDLVNAAMDRSTAQRQARLLAAPRFPPKVQVTTWTFARNPDVVAEVLHHAKGVCQMCDMPAPFIRRRDETPYLEVHHRVQLSHGGEDTIENAIAVCPNCHREAHYA
jgi:hypothetical protein